MSTFIASSMTLLALGLVPLGASAAETDPDAAVQAVPGTVIFHARYQHRNSGREIQQPSELWLKQTADGALAAVAQAPFMNSTEIALGATAGGFTSHQLMTSPAGNRPGIQVKLEFADGQARLTRRGLRQDCDSKGLPVRAGAFFDPNTRPDLYCAANILLRAFAVKPGEAKEFRVFDWDNTGDALADYTIRVEHVGKERVEVPAGVFEADHLVLTQRTSADTWFKKRAGHTTDFWVLDNYIIVRIRRNREPYELALLDYTIPDKLPGQVSGPFAKNQESAASDRSGPALDAASRYAADWAAFVREVDLAYPFFELKGIRRDWAQAKARLSDRVQTCASDTDFLWIVAEAIRCLRDGHMGISETKVPPPKSPPKRYYPGVSFMPATQGRIVVMSAQAHADKLKPGTVITTIDGRDAATVLEEKAKEAWSADSSYLVSVSSPQRARLFAYRWPLIASSNSTHTLHYLVEGQERELRVVSDVEPRGWPHTYNLPANLTRTDRTLSYTRLPSGAAYMALRTVGPETAAGMQRAVAAHPDAKGWIIDLRGNGGGGYDTNLLAQLKALPRPVVALIDAGCISAGETLARDLAQLAGARLMGSRTAGASSAKRQWRFPSGIASVTFSTRSRWRSDGQPIEFNGITPDQEIEAVPEEVAQGFNSEILRAEEHLARVAAAEGVPRSDSHHVDRELLAPLPLFAALALLSPGLGQAESPQPDRDIPPATKAEIAKLQSSDLRQRSDAIMKLRYLGMRGEANAAIPALIRMLDSEVEFPSMVLILSSLSSVTQSCSDELTFGGEAAETLARIGRSSEDLLALLKSENWRIRANAIRALGGLKDRRAVGDLLSIAQGPTEHWEVRGNALLALGSIGDQGAATSLIAALKDDRAPVRAAAATALGPLAVSEGLDPLLLALKDPDSRVRLKAAGSLGQLKGGRAVEALIGALQQDKDRVVREVAAAALRRANDHRALGALVAALKDEYPNVQINAAAALGELRSPEALEPLLDLLENANQAVRAAAAGALGNLSDPRALSGLISMVRVEEQWEIPLQRGLEALAKLGHKGAKVALEESRRHRPDWKEWWRRNKDELLKAEGRSPLPRADDAEPGLAWNSCQEPCWATS